MAVVFAGIGSRASAIVDINASTGGNLLVTSGKPFFFLIYLMRHAQSMFWLLLIPLCHFLKKWLNEESEKRIPTTERSETMSSNYYFISIALDEKIK